MGVGGEGSSPGDVAMAGGVGGVGCFGEDPFGAGKDFAEGKEIGGDIVLGTGESLFADRELVHEREAEVVFFGGEIDRGKAAGELAGGFPADLAAETGFVAGGLESGEFFEEKEQSGFEKVPIFGACGEESAEPEFGAVDFVDVDGGEIAVAGGGDVKAEAELGG